MNSNDKGPFQVDTTSIGLTNNEQYYRHINRLLV
jgi:hypothetical protein